MINTPSHFTLPVGLADFIGAHTTAWGPFCRLCHRHGADHYRFPPGHALVPQRGVPRRAALTGWPRAMESRMPLDDLRAFYRTGERNRAGTAAGRRLPGRRPPRRRAAPSRPKWTRDGPFAGLGARHLRRRGSGRRRDAAGRGTDNRGRSRRRTAGTRLRHLVRRRERPRGARLAAGAALHGGADLRLDGELHGAARPPSGGWADTLRPARLIRRIAFSGLRHPGARAQSRTPTRPSTPWTCPSRPTIPTCSCTATTARRRAFSISSSWPIPPNVEWQRHFADAYGRAADAIGFNGFHIDTYGYPRAATDRQGTEIDMRAAYESFLVFFRSRAPRTTWSASTR